MSIKRRKDNKQRVLKEGEYQRQNGTFEFKWRDRRGKRHSIYAKTLDDLRAKEVDVLRDVLDGIREDKCNVTINDLYNTWVRIKKGLKDNTFQGYKYFYEQFVEQDFGKTKIIDVKKSDIRAFYNYLKEERGLKVATIDSIHTVLHQVLQLGVDDEYLRFNPSDNALKELKTAYDDADKRRSLTIEEQKLFESFLAQQGPYSRWQPIFTVLLWTGMRVGECCGLRWSDIDLSEGTINVNHTLIYYNHSEGGCYFGINTPKSPAGFRTIPMLPKVRDAFVTEKAFQEEVGIRCTAAVDGYTDFIFVNRFGNVQHQGTLNKALRRIIRDCNFEVMDKNDGKDNIVTLPKFSNHTLRHTFTTRMCEAGVNLKAMQEILGHKDVEVTLGIYADATEALKKKEMINFEKYFTDVTEEQTKPE